jgi:hypothetical protein
MANKAGRKRKPGARREPNGRISRAGEREKIMTVALEQRRRMGLDGAAARDQRAESPCGRLALQGRLTDQEYEAAEHLRTRRAAFLAELARPVRLADLAAGAGDMGGPTPGPGGFGGSDRGLMVSTALTTADGEPRARPSETPAERRERALRQWASAEEALALAVGGSRWAFGMVVRVACDLAEPAGEAEVVWLKRALGLLALKWGIDDPDRGAEKGAPGLRAMRLSLDGRETWRFPKRKTTGKVAGGH